MGSDKPTPPPCLPTPPSSSVEPLSPAVQRAVLSLPLPRLRFCWLVKVKGRLCGVRLAVLPLWRGSNYPPAAGNGLYWMEVEVKGCDIRFHGAVNGAATASWRPSDVFGWREEAPCRCLL